MISIAPDVTGSYSHIKADYNYPLFLPINPHASIDKYSKLKHNYKSTMVKPLTKVIYKPDSMSTDEFIMIVNAPEVR